MSESPETEPENAPEPVPAEGRRWGPLLFAMGVLVVLAVVITVAVIVVASLDGDDGDGGFDAERIAGIALSGDASDPFQWEADRGADFSERATLALSDLHYVMCRGGIVASARRTA